MGLLSRIWRKGAGEAKSASSASFDLTNREMISRAFGAPTHSGKSITESGALGVAAWWSCARLISESLGSMPWALKRRDERGNAQPADDHPLHELLAGSPNRDQTDVEFRESIGLSLAGAGNFYAWRENGARGRVLSLMPLRPRAVRPMRKQGNNTTLRLSEGEAFFRLTDRGKTEDVGRDRIWQVKLFGSDPLVGLSPIGAAREVLGGALASEEFANRFFSQGGMPAGTISYPGWLEPHQRDEARKHLQELVGGLGKAHQFAMFEGGVKPEPWQAMSMEDMQFIAGRRFSVVEVCRFCRVPPHLVYDLEKASYASIEMQNLEYLTFSLMPYMKRIEASVAKWLLTPEDRAAYLLKFNADALLRPTTKERYEAHASALQNGWKTRAEVRALEDLPRVDGLDEFTVQVNLTPVQLLEQMMRGNGGDKAIGQLAEAVRLLAQQKKRLVYDDRGEIIGVEPVAELRTH